MYPLLEIFGHACDNFSAEAVENRAYRKCPFLDNGALCNKVSVENPLGVCSIESRTGSVITCPIRFQEKGIIFADAAKFFFPDGGHYEVIPEVKVFTASGETAGNIDFVLAELNSSGKCVDFGSLEIQAVYISGNVRQPFEAYMSDPEAMSRKKWGGKNSPRPDFLSSSRKRLAPQMMMKGGILKSWGKKQVIVLQKSFFNTLPPLTEIPSEKSQEADIMWLIYDLHSPAEGGDLRLSLVKRVFTKFESALLEISRSEAGEIEKMHLSIEKKLKAIKKVMA